MPGATLESGVRTGRRQHGAVGGSEVANLERDAGTALPGLERGLEGEVDRTVDLSEARAHAEPDGVDGRRLGKDELEMGGAAAPGGDQASLGVEGLGDEDGVGVARAERTEGGEGADGALGELVGVDQGIHAAAGLEVLLAEAAGGDGLEVSAEVDEALGVQA
jgi:hypothetical protein